jgi:hypothetical protein
LEFFSVAIRLSILFVMGPRSAAHPGATDIERWRAASID